MSARRAVVVLAAAALLAALGVGLLVVPGLLAPEEPPPIEHVVVRGDTLFLIAKAHGITVDALRAANGIEGDLIEVGQVLRIPGGRAEAPAVGAKRARGPRTPRAAAPGTADEAPLRMPAPKPCLAGPSLDDLDAEEGAVASAGLSYAQVKAAMDGFVGHTLRCVTDGQGGTVRTSITVGCDGRVAHVEILDDGHLAGEAVGCVRDTLRHTPFPAHDMPDGYTFEYPLTFSF